MGPERSFWAIGLMPDLERHRIRAIGWWGPFFKDPTKRTVPTGSDECDDSNPVKEKKDQREHNRLVERNNAGTSVPEPKGRLATAKKHRGLQLRRWARAGRVRIHHGVPRNIKGF
jgi:hypothetical protein